MDYRIYALARGTIKAREDFEAETDAEALVIATQLSEAGVKFFDEVELWQGSRRIGSQIAHRSSEQIAHLDDAALTSRRAIAQSRLLLERLGETLDHRAAH